MQVAKIEIKELGVTVTREHTGYTLFSRQGEHLVAYQRLGERHHVIPRERPAATLDDTRAVVELVLAALGDSNPKAPALVARALWKDWDDGSLIE